MTLAAAVSQTRADAKNVVQRQPSLGKITTRPSLPEDAEFMLELYATTHEQELAELGWSLADHRSFVIMQAQAEEWKLGRRYPGMDRVTIGIDGTSIGRLLVCMRDDVLHLVDLSLMPRFRGQGVGSQLMAEIMHEAREECVPIKIRVLKNSRSFTFVSRLGFDDPLDFGRYVELTWTPPAVGPERHTRRGARVRVPEQTAGAVREFADAEASDEPTPELTETPEVALLTEEEAWAMLRDGDAVEDVPVVEDVVEDLPVVDEVVDDVPAVEDVPLVEDVVEDPQEPEPPHLLRPLPEELTDALTDELFDRLTAHVLVDVPGQPTYVDAGLAADHTPALVPEGVAEFEEDEPVVFRIGSDQYDPFT